MSCDLTQSALAVWDPHDDLPDLVVGHLDDCAGCREAFDARFPPPLVPCADREPAPLAVARPETRRWSLAATAVAAAAGILLIVGMVASRPDAPPQEPEVCDLDPWLPPECPTA